LRKEDQEEGSEEDDQEESREEEEVILQDENPSLEDISTPAKKKASKPKKCNECCMGKEIRASRSR